MGKMLMRLFTAIHARLVKATGRVGGGETDGSVLVLRHVGARSGKVRDTPLMFLNHRNGFAVVASMGGAPTNPAWYHNLRANPDTTVWVSRQGIQVRAREAEGEERAELWHRLVNLDPRWSRYEVRASRVLPIMILDRR